ncbi:amidohydrolase family protein [Mucilaginibacter mali]|uniref:Amidohydrolase family protein n=1 Tax=Mucilaginibacter mali TaxID=2740462 RepID=A0A7D4UAF6_9SPHI|nr:amidohydrolase family protein [Mucilaginibacter mali]QKJ29918.1 amidohydrolase family protein [Mucilaginibacter mali]
MKLSNVYRVGSNEEVDIHISGGLIVDATDVHDDNTQLVFNDAVIFPGLINSHDHLDFNLFSQLGDRQYQNYTEWGNYIHKKYPQEIAAVLNVPQNLRTQWGVYKNLLCGVTTVVNHGEQLPISNSPVTILDNCQSLHSVQFEKQWKRRLNNPLRKNMPVVIHTGEGIDKAAETEIDQLINWNLLHREMIGVHGVAMTPRQAKEFKALVWCPQTNYFMLGVTAPVNRLKNYTQVLFGTDSTLTGDWNIWEHIRTARKAGYLDDQELYNDLTISAAKTWELNAGIIASGRDADIVVARLKGAPNTIENLLSIGPADILLVIHKGNIRLFDEILYSQLNQLPKQNFSKIRIGGVYKYVYGDLPKLMADIKRYYTDAQFPVHCTCHN